MRIRILICLSAVALTACTDTLEMVAPRVFYGRLVSADATELCVADPRDEDPDQQRCFLNDAELPEDVDEGDILNVRYELEGEQQRAVSVVRAVEN